MRKTHFLTIAATAAATLGLTAALGFRQPDGIEPPPGPVMDTQPSLASIDQKLDAIYLQGAYTNTLQVLRVDLVNGTPVTVLDGINGNVRIHSILFSGERSELFDVNGNSIAFLSGNANEPGVGVFGGGQALLGGLAVSTPLTANPRTNFGGNMHIYYWIEE